MDIAQSVAPPRALPLRLRIDRYVAANLLLWVFTYLLTTLRMFMPGDGEMPNLWVLAGRRVIVCFGAFLVCLAYQRLLTWAQPWKLPRRLLLAVGLALAGGVFYALFNHLVMYVVAPITEAKSSLKELAWSWAMTFSVLVWPFVAWCAIVLAMQYDQEAREKTLRLVQAQALAAESQNRMLRYQINPHFLFNTLNALSSLILQKDHARADKVVLSLSAFLRASLEQDPGEKTSLAEEIGTQRQYLEIEQIRFGDRLKLREKVGGRLGEARVPSFILQPLVENAVKHGVARSSAPVTVEILAEADDGALRITVRDDAVPDLSTEPVHLGVGLDNVRRRLALMYGAAGKLTCGRRPRGGFAAVLELPLERR